jgi:hypothetical protein
MIRDIVSCDPALNQAAWNDLQGIAGLLPADDGDITPRRAGNGGYLEF